MMISVCGTWEKLMVQYHFYIWYKMAWYSILSCYLIYNWNQSVHEDIDCSCRWIVYSPFETFTCILWTPSQESKQIWSFYFDKPAAPSGFLEGLNIWMHGGLPRPCCTDKSIRLFIYPLSNSGGHSKCIMFAFKFQDSWTCPPFPSLATWNSWHRRLFG